MQQLYVQVKKVSIHFLFMLWTVWKPLNGYNFEKHRNFIFLLGSKYSKHS